MSVKMWHLSQIGTLILMGFAGATSAYAGSMYIYKDSGGQVLLTNVSPSGNFDKFTKKVKVTHYPDAKMNTPTRYGSAVPSRSHNRHAYDSLIRAAAARHNLDPGLLKAVMHTESSFNPNALSPVGAQGLMQLMPATARRFSVYNAWDPAQNIEGSAKYLAWLMRRFKNNVSYVLAGYNAGEGNVDKYGGVPPFRETKNYVRKVLSRYHNLYQNQPNLKSNDMAATPVSYATSNNNYSPASYAASAYAALQ